MLARLSLLTRLTRLARSARDTMETRRSETTAVIAIGVVVAALAIGFFGWRDHVQTKAHELLAQLSGSNAAQFQPVIDALRRDALH